MSESAAASLRLSESRLQRRRLRVSLRLSRNSHDDDTFAEFEDLEAHLLKPEKTEDGAVMRDSA
jgi:hypothetical protein